MRFKEKVTIVTGGARGIGRAIARSFAEEGSQVVILDSLEKDAGNVVKEIESAGGRAAAMKVEATKGEEVQAVIRNVAAKWGRIDILVNNIGWVETMAGAVPFLETDEALWRKSLDLNLLVPMRFCHAVLPYMVKQQYGRVINIGSIAGRQPRAIAVAYSTAKAGVIALSRSLAVAMAPYNIRVNCVCPGTIATAQTLGAPPEHLDPILKPVVLGRLGQPEELAPAVLFLASDEASYILGQCLNVDGGNCML